MMDKLKIEDGISINGTPINFITDVKIHSTVQNYSKVTLTFLCEIEGLDDVKKDTYKFPDTEEN